MTRFEAALSLYDEYVARNAEEKCKMGILNTLKIVAKQQKRLQSKTEHRRAKLLERQDEQLAMVNALIAGE